MQCRQRNVSVCPATEVRNERVSDFYRHQVHTHTHVRSDHWRSYRQAVGVQQLAVKGNPTATSLPCCYVLGLSFAAKLRKPEYGDHQRLGSSNCHSPLPHVKYAKCCCIVLQLAPCSDMGIPCHACLRAMQVKAAVMSRVPHVLLAAGLLEQTPRHVSPAVGGTPALWLQPAQTSATLSMLAPLELSTQPLSKCPHPLTSVCASQASAAAQERPHVTCALPAHTQMVGAWRSVSPVRLHTQVLLELVVSMNAGPSSIHAPLASLLQWVLFPRISALVTQGLEVSKSHRARVLFLDFEQTLAISYAGCQWLASVQHMVTA